MIIVLFLFCTFKIHSWFHLYGIFSLPPPPPPNWRGIVCLVFLQWKVASIVFTLRSFTLPLFLLHFNSYFEVEWPELSTACERHILMDLRHHRDTFGFVLYSSPSIPKCSLALLSTATYWDDIYKELSSICPRGWDSYPLSKNRIISFPPPCITLHLLTLNFICHPRKKGLSASHFGQVWARKL